MSLRLRFSFAHAFTACSLFVALACGSRTGELPGAGVVSSGAGGRLGVDNDPNRAGAESGGASRGGVNNSTGDAGARAVGGGQPSGGSSHANGGAPASGGASSSSGAANGGAANGGAANGGAANGGAANGGAANGGVPSSAGDGGTFVNGGAPANGGTLSTSGGSAGAVADCCVQHASASCSNADVASCVCHGQGMFGGDPFCCAAQWDSQCAEEVERFQCGQCRLAP